MPPTRPVGSPARILRLGGLVADRSPHLDYELRWNLIHAVSRARVFGALLQHFLLGLTAGNENRNPRQHRDN